MAKNKNKQQILWIAIFVVAIADAFSTAIGTIPILGDIVSAIGNVVWEIIELGLVFGLISTIKK